MSELVVEHPGAFSTIQDGGRWGLQHLGVPVSGWMDCPAARLANRLAGNDEGEGVIEITWRGPALRADVPLVIAVAGADFLVRLGERTRRVPFVECVSAGEPIAFLDRRDGARAYLAMGGSLLVEPVLGSVATDVRSRLGGVSGRALRAGDRVAVRPRGNPAAPRRTADARCAWIAERRLRLLRPPDSPLACRPAYDALCGASCTVTPQSDRMGYRLSCERPLPASAGALLSQPTVEGMVQVPPDGNPILLMADRQTTGGYAIAGVVAAADLPVAAQFLPGDVFRFEPCDWDEASRAADAREREWQALAAELGR